MLRDDYSNCWECYRDNHANPNRQWGSKCDSDRHRASARWISGGYADYHMYSNRFTDGDTNSHSNITTTAN